MILREPISVTFVLITLLIFAFSGTVFHGLYTTAQRDCHQRNSDLVAAGTHGPPAPRPHTKERTR